MTSTHPKQPVWWAPTRTGPVVLALTAALILTATPAVAKKGSPPEVPVTIEFVEGYYGLANCDPADDEATPLMMVMESRRGGGTSLLAEAHAGNPADLDLVAVIGEESFARGECDYGTRPYSPVDDFGTLLWIAFDRTEDLAEFVWHFDAYVEPGTHPRTGKPHGNIVRERFTLALDDLTGEFKLSKYTNDEPDGPTWTLIGSQNLTFEISY